MKKNASNEAFHRLWRKSDKYTVIGIVQAEREGEQLQAQELKRKMFQDIRARAASAVATDHRAEIVGMANEYLRDVVALAEALKEQASEFDNMPF